MALQFTFPFHRNIYIFVNGQGACFFANFSTMNAPLKLEYRKSLPSDGHSSPRDVPEINILLQKHLVDILAEVNTFTSLGLG
jgi:hypothetical protein